MSDDLAKRVLKWVGSNHNQTEAIELMEAQAAEIARLRAALTTARREGMKDAAKWHEAKALEASAKAASARNFQQLLRQSDFHMESAAAIRAAAKEEQ